MKGLYKSTFVKDLKRLRGAPEFARIWRLVFEEMPRWEKLAENNQIKRLNAKDNAYRIRVGDYRIGFYCTDDALVFARVLHRREIYRYFP